MYSLLRKFLFKLDPEKAHFVTLQTLKIANALGLSQLYKKNISQPRTVMGLQFANPFGIAAGLDKDADYIDALASLGFGFLEVGTITVQPQTGNPLPRVFRLVNNEALINRMGFPGKGIDYACNQLSKIKYQGVLGINIGKNRDTPIDKALDDYVVLFKRCADFASYITVNISSPNTEGLRNLQKKNVLRELLAGLKQEQKNYYNTNKKYVPLVVKIAPDLSENELREIAAVLLEQNIDGVIATNTTTSRHGIENNELAKELGGLSGRPLHHRSTHVIKQLNHHLQQAIPIIGCGGVMDKITAQEKFQAGAKLLQVYTGLIYQGPQLLSQLAEIESSQ